MNPLGIIKPHQNKAQQNQVSISGDIIVGHNFSRVLISASSYNFLRSIKFFIIRDQLNQHQDYRMDK